MLNAGEEAEEAEAPPKQIQTEAEAVAEAVLMSEKQM
jgi:hypothetical protein